MRGFERITQNPAVMGGKPCIRGMRVTVGMIAGQIRAGETIESLLAGLSVSRKRRHYSGTPLCGRRTEESAGTKRHKSPPHQTRPKGNVRQARHRRDTHHSRTHSPLPCVGRERSRNRRRLSTAELEDIRAAQGYAAGYLGHESMIAE